MKKKLMLSLLTATVVVNSANAADLKPEISNLQKAVAENSALLLKISKTVSKSNRFPFKTLFAVAGAGVGIGYTYRDEIEATRQNCVDAGRQFLARGVKFASEQLPKITTGKPVEKTSATADAPRAAVEASDEHKTSSTSSETDKE